jgi:Tfp pilus assembly protein PilW
MTRRARAGFTVVELIVASALSMLIVAVVIFMFTTQRRAYWRERQTNEMKQNMRTAMDMIIRDVRMAGYGMPMPAAGFLPRWFNWVPGVTNRLCIIRGATTNDPQRHCM